MDHYVLRQTERNATTDTTFLFPMSYLDSIWQSESFDRLIVKCGSADGCPLSLSYAAIIPTSEVEPTLRANLAGGGSEGGDAQQQLPVLPAPPLSYWICGVFPFPWCPLPAPSPPAPTQRTLSLQSSRFQFMKLCHAGSSLPARSCSCPGCACT